MSGLGYTLVCGPELEFYLCQQAADGSWQRYANDPGNALLNPTVNSFKRFGPDTLAPWLIDWGLDNRSAMVRIPHERGAAARMEVRLGGATANPYLAMAALGAAVYLGIHDKVEPPGKLVGYGYDPDRSQMLPCGWARRSTPWNPTAISAPCSASTS